ncbi:MAB_1171c family putative transporter [Streptomyces sp. NPDC018019]|uniref:MAB_1171c family putative transporter n=1 Tax=Streptomyces sp. NPDC018019 TaxID=3365030 RepID=UPI0037B1C2A6
MIDSLTYVVAGLLLLTAVWRLPSAFRGGSRRTLWGVFAAFATAWLLKTPLVDGLVSRTGVNDLSSLLKHTVAIVGICSLLLYATAMYGSARHEGPAPRDVRVARFVMRVAVKASFATVCAMAALFFFAIDRSRPTEHFLTGHAGDLGLTLYMGVLYLYMGSAAAVCAYQWGNAARRARRSLLRTGLTLMAAAMCLAVLYALLRTAYLAAVTVTPPTAGFAALQETVTDAVQLVLFPLLVLGVAVPATQAAVNRWRALRALADLHPLWSALARAVPDHVLDPPSALLPGRRCAPALNRCRDLLRLTAPVEVRLHRCATEVRDALRDLRHYVPDDLIDRAAAVAGAEGHHGARARATAEAYWIGCALAAKAAGERPSRPAAGFTSGADGNPDGEVAWLRAVACAHRRLDLDAVRSLAAVRPLARPEATA